MYSRERRCLYFMNSSFVPIHKNFEERKRSERKGETKESIILICCSDVTTRSFASEGNRQIPSLCFHLPRHCKTSGALRERGKEWKICKAISIHQVHLSPIFWRASTPSHSTDVFLDSALNKSSLSLSPRV